MHISFSVIILILVMFSSSKPTITTPAADPLDTFIWMRNNVKGISTPGVLTGSAKRYKPVREMTDEPQKQNLGDQSNGLLYN